MKKYNKFHHVRAEFLAEWGTVLRGVARIPVS